MTVEEILNITAAPTEETPAAESHSPTEPKGPVPEPAAPAADETPIAEVPPLAAELKRLREASGLSKMKLTTEMGCNYLQVMRWEKGEARPSIHNLKRLDILYGSDLVERFGHEVKGGRLKDLSPVNKPEARAAEPLTEPQPDDAQTESAATIAHQPVNSLYSIWKQIEAELGRAKEKHPVWPDDLVHASAIVSEECGELTKACLDFHHFGGSLEDVRTEAVQLAAMAIRLLENIPLYKLPDESLSIRLNDLPEDVKIFLSAGIERFHSPQLATE